MGLLDFISDPIGSIVKLPGEILEKTAETIVRLPEIPIGVVKGLAKGVEKGLKKLDSQL